MSSTQIIAIPSEAPGGLHAQGTSRFGRCPFFTIVEYSDGNISEVKVVKNEANGAMGGAGPMAANLIANEKANIVIGAHYGPNAASALLQAGMELYGTFNGSVSEILDAYVHQKLTKVNNATVGSHSGM